MRIVFDFRIINELSKTLEYLLVVLQDEKGQQIQQQLVACNQVYPEHIQEVRLYFRNKD